MDKGKGKRVDPSSQGMWVPSTLLYPPDDSDDDSDAAAVAAAMAASRDEASRAAASSAAAGGGPGASSSSAAAAVQQDLTPFEDGQYVRLRNRGRGGYLYADETGRFVTVGILRGKVNTAWGVQILPSAAGGRRVLLRGAYGRYLSATRNKAEADSGLIGDCVQQCNFENLDDLDIQWSVARGKRGSVVLLHLAGVATRALRANGRYKRWNTGVTVAPVDVNRPQSVSSMMEWEVKVIPMTVERPPYQRRLPQIRWSEDFSEEVEVSFAYAWFGNNGRVEYQGWMDMRFEGRSLTQLGNAIASRLGNGVQFENMSLCIQAGNHGRPIPLLTDLPYRHDPVTILVFMVNQPDHNAVPLRFPDLAARSVRRNG